MSEPRHRVFKPGMTVNQNVALKLDRLPADQWWQIEELYPEIRAADDSALFWRSKVVIIHPPQWVSAKTLHNLLGAPRSMSEQRYPYYEDGLLHGVLVYKTERTHAALHIYRVA